MNNASLFDHLSRKASSAINMLLVGYPVRTALGVIVGLAAHTLFQIFSPLLNRWPSVVNFSNITAIQFVFLGLLILHIPTIILHISKKASVLGETEEKVFAIIRKAEEEGMTKTDGKKLRLQFCSKYLDSVVLKQSTREEIEKVNAS